jgi:S-DNA-T family DNA segregation ATPase FtsK/SpoIIIE
VSGRSKKRASRKKKSPWYESAWLSGLLLVAVAAFLGLSLTGGVGPWWHVFSGDPQERGQIGDLHDPTNPGGVVGSIMSVGLHGVFGGLWCWVFPAYLLVLGVGFLTGKNATLKPWLLRCIPLWLATSAWIAQPTGLFPGDSGPRYGGIVGYYLGQGFHWLFGDWGAPILLSVVLLAVILVVFKPWLGWIPGLADGFGSFLLTLGRGLGLVLLWPLRRLGQGLLWLLRLPGRLLEDLRERMAERKEARRKEAESRSETATESMAELRADGDSEQAGERNSQKRRRHHTEPGPGDEGAGDDDPLDDGHRDDDDAPWDDLEDDSGFLPDDDLQDGPGSETEELHLPGATGEFMGDGEAPVASEEDGRQTSGKPRKKKRRKSGPAKLPGLELLTPAGPETQPLTTAELDAAADLLEATLRSFGVEGEIKDVRPGPVVTTFEFQPGIGIKVSQIVQRSDDLALAMRARSLRMEAPIPGKAAVGIEIPNPVARMVRLREVLELVDDSDRDPLTVVLGKDVVGRPVSIDIASLPHLLVAGSTGSGKSVCLNAMISNLLLRNTPDTLRMVLIDPKMLEMSVYNGIPHLLLPVVTDPKEALKALQWMVAQMEFRYRSLAKHSVRNIKQYNDKVARGEVVDSDGQKVTEPMPYFLTIVDELADLMLQLGKDLEDLITRLAQKARAVGIHLILATQRPSVDVLTGVIKANIPCRIAFRVIQMNDSRTILDMKGAEQLLGHGDMLYLQPGRALPVRVHGSFIDVDECEAISGHWNQYEDLTDEIDLLTKPDGSGGMHTGEDDLFEEAMRIVVQHQSGSTSLLQRRLRIGYTRAGRLMDMLEEAGIVGPFTGSKARDVLLRPDDLPDPGET